MHILFIEDEEELNELATEELTLLGHQVHSVTRMAGAKAYFEKNAEKIDLIIADHRLPDGQGSDFVIEAKKTNPKLGVCIVSGCLIDKEIQSLEQVGIPYFPKPLLYSSVLRELTKPIPGAPIIVKAEEAPANIEEEIDFAEETIEEPTPSAKKGFFSSLLRKKESKE